MGSVNHPKLFDPATIATLKTAFHDVWTTVEADGHVAILCARRTAKQPSFFGFLISRPPAPRSEMSSSLRCSTTDRALRRA